MTFPIRYIHVPDVAPQHIQLKAVDVIENVETQPVVATIYTGAIRAGHGAESATTSLVVQTPLAAFVRSQPNILPGQKAIFAFDDQHFKQQFRGAVVSTSVSYHVVKGTEATVSVQDSSVDLREVELDDASRTVVHVAVLSFLLRSSESHIGDVSYHANVLSVINADMQQRVIRVGDNGWTGKVNKISEIIEVPGAPHP